MKPLNISIGVIIFFLGIAFGNLLWHLRFMNPVLKREMIMMMQEGNGYFLTWFLFDLLIVMVMVLFVCIMYRHELRSKIKSWRKKQ